MRAIPLVLAALLAPPALAQTIPGFPPSEPDAKIKAVMTDVLERPAVQRRLRVSETQRTLAGIRLQREAVRFALDVAAATDVKKASGDTLNVAFTPPFTPGELLFPFLAANQLALLRREALRDSPLESLNTDEVAASLGLRPDQRARLRALYVRNSEKVLASDRPSVRLLRGAFAKLQAVGGQMEKTHDGEGLTPGRIAILRRALDRFFADVERATVLDAKEWTPEDPDPLPVLTAAQRARFRALSRS